MSDVLHDTEARETLELLVNWCDLCLPGVDDVTVPMLIQCVDVGDGFVHDVDLVSRETKINGPSAIGVIT